MLHDFIINNRERIIERARQRVRERTAPKSLESKLEHGIPLFLTQLVDALGPVESAPAPHPVSGSTRPTQINDSAALHGHELLRHGFSVEQVVHGYGDVCQIVTELANESNAPISVHDYHVFNLCLDDAIAGAVTAYGQQRERDVAYSGTERVGVLAHELRNLLNTAVLSFDAIRRGSVGLTGSTGAIHLRSLAGLRTLAERALAEVRLEAGKPMLERVPLAELIDEVQTSAAMEAESYGLEFEVNHVADDVAIDADRQLLSSALSNLLQNAFKYSHAGGKVVLTTRSTAERVLIDVHDECGGLPPGKAEELFRPFAQGSATHTGLGLGLSIALSAVQAHAGSLHVRDLPGVGCVFTIELPRQLLPPVNIFQGSLDSGHGSLHQAGAGSGQGARSTSPRRKES